MIQPLGHHLAEFNFGLLRHDWDDARIAGFVEGLDQVNSIAERSPGFVWRMTDEDMEAEQLSPDSVFGGNPRMASTLSVWTDVASLENFVWNTVHRQFYGQKNEWFDPETGGNLVMWWVPEGHRPTVLEGMKRWEHLRANGNTDHAFSWEHIEQATQWRDRGCAGVAAE